MKILILEDTSDRQKLFRKNLVGCSKLVFAETAAKTIELLSTQKWDAVFLDHDLNGESNQPSGPGTGYEVAEWLRANPKSKPEIVAIHSFNNEGRTKMLGLIPGSVDAPGAWAFSEIEDGKLVISLPPLVNKASKKRVLMTAGEPEEKKSSPALGNHAVRLKKVKTDSDTPFDTWWNKTYGSKQSHNKYLAKKAWQACMEFSETAS